MGKNYFTSDQIEKLKVNPYVKNISEKAITYTEEFREEFYKQYTNGKSPSSILADFGLDPRILGESRIKNIAKRVKSMASKGTFEDTRAGNSGRPREQEMSQEEELNYLRHKVEYQKQEIEALKKINFVEKKKIWKQQLKSIKSSSR